MADTHETVADIIAWLRKPREGENAYLTLWRDEIADRLEAAQKREAGDAAKLREALKATLDLLWDIHNANRSPQSNQAYAVIRQIKAALSAPPRNCDVGTAEEQYSRMFRECYEWPCMDCKQSDKYLRKCALLWAQKPYVDKDGGAK